MSAIISYICDIDEKITGALSLPAHNLIAVLLSFIHPEEAVTHSSLQSLF
jgi:hypothetical protein